MLNETYSVIFNHRELDGYAFMLRFPSQKLYQVCENILTISFTIAVLDLKLWNVLPRIRNFLFKLDSNFFYPR